MLRVVLFMFFLFMFFRNSVAQDANLIGKVVFEKDKPASFSSILVLKEDKLMKTVLSDSTGFFSMKLPFGLYNLTASYLGNTVSMKNFYVRNDTMITFRIKDSASNNMLNEVTVVGKRKLVEKKIDRLIFNIENSISLIGGNALDAVGKSPGVRISTGNEISLIGKSAVRVMIDDRLIRLSGDDLAALLKSIPSDNILRIEVITTPPAKYDAEGNAGLINIILKKNKQEGLFGNINTGVVIRHYLSNNEGVTLSYSKNKVTVNVGANRRNDNSYLIKEKELYYPTSIWQDTSYNIIKDKNMSGNIGVDYLINDKMLLGIQYKGSRSTNKKSLISTTRINSYDLNIDSIINTNSSMPNTTVSHSVNLHHEFKIDTNGRKLFTDADYFFYNNKQEQMYRSRAEYPNQLESYEYPQTYQFTPQRIEVYSMQTEMLLPLKSVNLSFGGKVSFISNHSSSDFLVIENEIARPDTARNYIFGYNENTQAFFIDGQKSFKNFDIKLGFRGEYTHTVGKSLTLNQRNTNSYFRLFPSFYFLLKSLKNQSLSFTYGRRIKRPEYFRLNPFRLYTNPFLYSEGNPLLQPSYSDVFEVQHVFNNWLISQMFAGVVNNGFDQIGIPDPHTGVMEILQKNFFKTFNYGITETINKTFFKVWENQTQAVMYYTNTSSSNPNTQKNIKGWSAYFSTSNTYTWNEAKTLLSSVDFSYQLPMVDGLDHVKSYYSLDFGFKALLMHKRLTLGFSVTDVLRSNKVYFNSLINNMRQNYGGYSDTQSIRVSLTYKFGKSLSKRTRNSMSNDAEKNRVGQ